MNTKDYELVHDPYPLRFLTKEDGLKYLDAYVSGKPMPFHLVVYPGTKEYRNAQYELRGIRMKEGKR